MTNQQLFDIGVARTFNIIFIFEIRVPNKILLYILSIINVNILSSHYISMQRVYHGYYGMNIITTSD